MPPESDMQCDGLMEPHVPTCGRGPIGAKRCLPTLTHSPLHLES
jgi:hypothetical protein